MAFNRLVISCFLGLSREAFLVIRFWNVLFFSYGGIIGGIVMRDRVIDFVF
jgi:hypothetical protein